MKTARLCLLGFLAAAVPALSAEPGKNAFSRWKNLPQDENFFPIEALRYE